MADQSLSVVDAILESGQHRASIATLERVGDALGLRLVVSLEPVSA